MGIPISNDDPSKPIRSFSTVGQHSLSADSLVPCQLEKDAITVARPPFRAGGIASRVDVGATAPRSEVIALVLTAGSAIADKVLGRGDHVRGIEKLRRARLTLQPEQHCGCVLPYDLRVLGELS